MGKQDRKRTFLHSSLPLVVTERHIMNNSVEQIEVDKSKEQLVENQFLQTLEKVNSSVHFLQEIRTRYEKLIDTQADVVEPLEDTTDALRNLAEVLNSLKDEHSKTLKNLQDQFITKTKKSCDQLNLHTEALLEKVDECKASFDSLQDARSSLLSSAKNVADELADNGSKLLHPFEKLNLKFEKTTLEVAEQIKSISVDFFTQSKDMLVSIKEEFEDFHSAMLSEFNKNFEAMEDSANLINAFTDKTEKALHEQTQTQESLLQRINELFEIWKKDRLEKEASIKAFIKFQKIVCWFLGILLTSVATFLLLRF